MNSVAFVTELFYPSIGGQEVRFLKLARGLSKKGFSVRVYTTDFTGGSLPKEEDIDGINIIRYVVLRNYVRPGSRALSQSIKFINATRRLLREINKEYDFILLNQMPIFHLFFIPNLQKIGIDWCEVYRKGILKELIKFAAKRNNNATVVSEIIEEVLHRMNPFSRIEIIRTPIEIDKYIPYEEKDDNVILYIGRLVPHKNVLSLADSVIYLNEKLNQRRKLIIIGDGPLKDVLTKRYRNFGYIEILGKVDEKEKIEYLKKAFILAIPSYREGFPNVVAEAIASLTPILTIQSPLNNVYQFVERHRIGFVALSSSPKQLAKTIASISEKEWKQAMIREEKLRNEFQEEVNINKLITHIKRCLN